MTERYIHYHKNGNVTARLEIKREPDGIACGFVDRHADAIREAFDGKVSEAADAAFDRMCGRDRAYKYRPCVLRVEYSETKGKGRGVAVSISVLCTSGRRVLYSAVRRYRFRPAFGEAVFIGADKG